MGLTFHVDERVLIPRQDTETLAELVLRENPEKNIRLLDLCTGSGCLAVSLAVLGGYEEVDAGDISPDALEVAAAACTWRSAGTRGSRWKIFSGKMGLRI